MKLLKTLGVLRKKFEEVVFEDDEGRKVKLAVFPVTVAMYPEMQATLRPMLKTLSKVWNQHERHQTDTGQEVQTFTDEEGLPAQIIKTTAVAPEIARMRSEQHDIMVDEALDVIFSENTRLNIARLLADSLRNEEFSRPIDDDEALAFINMLDLVQLSQLVVAYIRVNATVFAPLVKGVAAKIQQKIRAFTQSSEESGESNQQDEQGGSEAPENPSD